MLLRIIAGVGAALFVVAVVRHLLEPRGFRRAAAPQPGSSVAPPPPQDTPLAEVDRLAQSGAYAEAMHALLLHSLATLRARAGPLAPSLTSREIVGRTPLPVASHEALAQIAAAVEVSHFGGRPAGPDDYQHCRGSFERFAAGLEPAR